MKYERAAHRTALLLWPFWGARSCKNYNYGATVGVHVRSSMAYFWKTVPFPCKWPIKKPETKTRLCNKFSLSYASAANGLFCLSLFDYPFFEMMMTHCRAVCDRSLTAQERSTQKIGRILKPPSQAPGGGGVLTQGQKSPARFFSPPDQNAKIWPLV